jgi:hypothetical protein
MVRSQDQTNQLNCKPHHEYTTAKLVLSCLFRYKENTSHSTSLYFTSHLSASRLIKRRKHTHTHTHTLPLHFTSGFPPPFLPTNTNSPQCHQCLHVEVEVTLRPTVSRPASLGVRRPSGTRDQFYFLLEIFFRQLRVCNFVRPLCREDWSVIYCTIASGPCQSGHSWVEVPQNSQPYFTVSSETLPTWRARSPYLYPPGTG